MLGLHVGLVILDGWFTISIEQDKLFLTHILVYSSRHHLVVTDKLLVVTLHDLCRGNMGSIFMSTSRCQPRKVFSVNVANIQEYFCGILRVPKNIVMHLNNVMHTYNLLFG